MLTLTLADSPELLPLTDRPTGPDYPPLPYGLTLDQAVAVRAREVKAGDLVLVEFSDESGVRRAGHIPTPYAAEPHALEDCPCDGCEECDDVDAWTLAEHSRVADVGWRFICLSPAEEDEPCALTVRNRPMAVIPADVVSAAKAAAAKAAPPVRTFTVTWTADFEANSPEEAIRLAYAQLKSYSDADSRAPELEADDGHEKVTVDLGQVEG
ncbi:hypothetical protein [Streptomyces noursei]|uniref:hypothetical protein n=1 Tax=Streptomyces noursei TaxID=1971 RepID=UPI001679B96F|nr:hypothetical protein [Streptomyces noursei]MCZ1014401.1 hypothetical protein [Streptomyces noursei]GGW94740.1 hypothetical protein GCM10010341_14870 [Streptomyces noursei]